MYSGSAIISCHWAIQPTHRHRDAERALHDAGVEVDVRIKFAADEIIVLQRDLLQRHRQLENPVVVKAQLFQHFVAGLAHELRARIVVLVHAMPEAHQLDPGILVLRPLDELADLGDVADLLQHLQRRLVGAAVRGTPQAGDARGDAGKRIGARRTREAHGRGGGVLLVVRVQDENPVERAHQHRVDLVFFGGHREHHAHEVGGIGQIVLRIHERLADRVFVGHGHDGGQLGDQPEGRDFAVLGVSDVERVVIERGERAHHSDHHRHRVRVAAEPGVEPRELFVHHGVMGDDIDEPLLLLLVRQLAVQQQVAHLEKVAVHRELLDRIAAVEQHARVAVDIRDFRAAARRGHEPGVVGEYPRLRVKRPDVDHVGTDCARQHRKLDRIALPVGKRGFFRGTHGVPSVNLR